MPGYLEFCSLEYLQRSLLEGFVFVLIQRAFVKTETIYISSIKLYKARLLGMYP